MEFLPNSDDDGGSGSDDELKTKKKHPCSSRHDVVPESLYDVGGELLAALFVPLILKLNIASKLKGVCLRHYKMKREEIKRHPLEHEENEAIAQRNILVSIVRTMFVLEIS